VPCFMRDPCAMELKILVNCGKERSVKMANTLYISMSATGRSEFAM